MKKLLWISALLWVMLAVLMACDQEEPADTSAESTVLTEAPTLAATDTSADTAPEDTCAPTSDAEMTTPEEPTESPSDTTPLPPESEEDPSTDTPTEAPTEPPTAPPTEAETTASEPEVTGPGTLIYVSNDELRYLDNNGDEVGSAYEPGAYNSWTSHRITLGKDQVAVIVDGGWAAFDSTSYEFGYIVNGEHFFSESYAREADAYVTAASELKGAKSCSRFYGGLTVEALKMGDNMVKFCVRLDGDVLCVLREYVVTLTESSVKLDGTYWNVDIDTWQVTGHVTEIQNSSNGAVAAGGVTRGAMLYCGTICVGEVDLSQYSKVVIYWGCDNGTGTQNLYKQNAANRFLVTKADTNGAKSPVAKDILASETYTLHGWRVEALEIDLTGVNYNGPVYITVDFLPGTLVLVSEIEFVK